MAAEKAKNFKKPKYISKEVTKKKKKNNRELNIVHVTYKNITHKMMTFIFVTGIVNINMYILLIFGGARFYLL